MISVWFESVIFDKNSKTIKSIFSFFNLIRWQNLLIIALCQIIARVFVVEKVYHSYFDFRFMLIMLVTLLIAAAGYIINDYFDVKIDLINKPNEVIIGREISRRKAILIHQFISGIAVIISLFINFKVVIICVLAVFLLWVYAAFYKKIAIVGNVLVAGLTASSLLIISVSYQNVDLILNIYAIFAFTITLIREIVKDIEDIKGDEKFGCKTLPILWGVRRTKYFLYLLIVIFVFLVISMSLHIGNISLYYIFSFLSIPTTYFIIKLYQADRKIHFSDLSKIAKIIMMLGIISMSVIN